MPYRQCGQQKNCLQSKASDGPASDPEAADSLNSLTYGPLALAAHEAPRESGLHSPLLRLMRAVYRPSAKHTSHQRCTPQSQQWGLLILALCSRAATDVGHASKKTLQGRCVWPKRVGRSFRAVKNFVPVPKVFCTPDFNPRKMIGRSAIGACDSGHIRCRCDSSTL